MSKWTSTPPDREGWYWWREESDAAWDTRQIDEDGDCSPYWEPASNIGGQWWPVPIPEPGEGEQ